MNENELRATHKLAGYAALIKIFSLSVIPNWHKSYVAFSGTHKKEPKENIIEEIYPSKYWPGDTVGDHLEFALKYDGTNLSILAKLFQHIPEQNILEYISSKPTGKYARRIWFLYEFLSGKTLPIDDLNQGNYVDLLDSDKYYTIFPAQPIRRQRVNNNLLGNPNFCPTIRRTEVLQNFEASKLSKRCQVLVSEYPPDLLKRALGYLYTKETKSSFEIEHINPSSTRTERFIALLQLGEKENFCQKQKLVEIQNLIVDKRFADADYRSNQNYIGEIVAWQNEKIHFVCPKPEDISELMGGLIAAHESMNSGNVPEVAHAAAIAYGFVFLHPFEDGNGRIHRFLIHNILSQRRYTPEGIMFPISAIMLKNPDDYDSSLEAFSRKLLPLVEYTLDEEGRMTVHNDTAIWYRFIEMTPQVEALFSFIQKTIDTELVHELSFLANYDKTKKAIQEITDMPDRLVDLFIRFCLQTSGNLSLNKRKSHFDFLSDEEIHRMEKAVQSAYKS